MKLKQVTGPGAATRKYDVLSVLMAHALAGDKHRQRLILRFMALITTRYNWQSNELSMGQADIARLWSVDPRTVKRDLARLKTLGWITVKHAGARGRVSVYAFDFDQVLRDTRPAWPNIGPDIIERLAPALHPRPAADNVVPIRAQVADVQGQGAWAQICRLLAGEDPALFAAWYAPLAVISDGPDHLTLVAPSRFHKSYLDTHLSDRLWSAIVRSAPELRGFTIET